MDFWTLFFIVMFVIQQVACAILVFLLTDEYTPKRIAWIVFVLICPIWPATAWVITSAIEIRKDLIEEE